MSPLLFAHQLDVFHALRATAEVFFAAQWRGLDVRPRFARFVAGPTGCGKTHVVRAVGSALGVPLLKIVATEWIPLGAANRGARPTWLDVALFCHRNERGIIFVDECDKLVASDATGWMNYIRTEALGLIQGDVPENLSLSECTELADDAEDEVLKRIRSRLRNAMLVVGAGAFQALWEARGQRRCGFQASRDPHDGSLSQAELARVIPAEVVNRFAAPILVLRPLHRRDYEHMLEQMVGRLPAELAARAGTIGRATLDRAVANRTGVRWLEEVVLQSLLARQAHRGSHQAVPSLHPVLP